LRCGYARAGNQAGVAGELRENTQAESGSWLALDDGPRVRQRIALGPCVEQRLTQIRIAVGQGAARPDLFAPSGPSRVIDQLRHLPMAASCLPALERAMGVAP